GRMEHQRALSPATRKPFRKVRRCPALAHARYCSSTLRNCTRIWTRRIERGMTWEQVANLIGGFNASSFDPDESKITANQTANSRKCAIDIACCGTHSGCGCQSDKRDNEQILDQSLTTFPVVKLTHHQSDSAHLFFSFLASCSVHPRHG